MPPLQINFKQIMEKRKTRCVSVDSKLDALAVRVAKEQRRSVSTIYEFALENLLLTPTNSRNAKAVKKTN